MKDILIIGGMGCGKTTLANAMNQEEDCNNIYTSKYAVRIPMFLQQNKYPELLSLPKEQYIDTIVANENVQTDNTPRENMDEFGQKIMDLYGESIIGEVVERVLSDERNIVDSVPKGGNVNYLKNKGLYVVGLYCSEKTQVERTWERKKGIDAVNYNSLEEQVRENNRYFEYPSILAFAHSVYNTEEIQMADYSRVAREVMQNADELK